MKSGAMHLDAYLPLRYRVNPTTALSISFVLLIVVLWSASFVIGFESALTALTLMSFGAAVLGLRYPVVGFFGVSMSCTLDPLTSNLLLTGGLLRWNTFNYWLLLVMFLYVTFLLRLNDLQTRLVQLLILLLGLELLISADLSRGIQIVFSVVTMFGLMVYIGRVGAEGAIWRHVALINGVLAAVGGMVFYILESSLPYVNPNIWSFFPLTALFIICLSFSRPMRTQGADLLLLLLACVNATWVFLSGSRGAILIALACIVFLLIQAQGIWLKLLVIAGATIFILIIASQFPDLQTHALGRLELLTDSSTSLRYRTSGRSELLIGGWHMFANNPLGIGTGGFPKAWSKIGNIEGLGNFERGDEFSAHAMWVKIIVENGVPGGLLLAAYVSSFALVGWRRTRDMRNLGILTTIIFTITFMVIEFQWARGIWFLAAGATVLLHHDKVAVQLEGALRRATLLSIGRSNE